MTLTAFARTEIVRLVEAAGERLTGDWVLVGGALAALWFSHDRATEDVDLVAVSGGEERRYELMDFAIAEGVPIEAVNSAADFFLHRIPGWEGELEVLHAGSRARILRPSPTLFLLLKIGRMSEADFGDCMALADFAETHELEIDVARVIARIDELDETEPSPAARRRVELGQRLSRRRA